MELLLNSTDTSLTFTPSAGGPSLVVDKETSAMSIVPSLGQYGKVISGIIGFVTLHSGSFLLIQANTLWLQKAANVSVL